MQRSDFPQRLGSALIDGLATASDGPRSQALERCLAQLRHSVGCDVGWWGLVDRNLDNGQPPRFHLAGTHGLSRDVLRDYVAVFGIDRFAAAVLASPGEAHHWSGTDDALPRALREWVKRYQLGHGLAICSAEPFGDQIFVVVLYRLLHGAPFSEEDTTLSEFLFQQLIMLWRRSLQDTLHAASTEALAGMFLASRDGRVLFCGSVMATQLQAMGWDPLGQTAPTALLGTPDAGGRVKIGDDWIIVTRDADVLRAELASVAGTPSMPTRLVQVATLACEGLAAKQIAAELGLTPATVRTYLRDAYAQLGVHNRVELHVAMQRAVRPFAGDPD